MKTLILVAVLLFVASPSYGQVTLGTSSSATNPERSGQASTGLFSSSSGAVSISSSGVEIVHVNGTGAGIGTSTPQTLLTINGNASGVPATAISYLQIVGADSTTTGVEMDAFGSNDTILFLRYDGTFASQSAILSGEALGSINGGGYNGSSVAPNKAGIIFGAGGNWSTSSEPAYIAFGTTPVGSTTKTERMRIDTTGNVGIGTTAPSSPLTVNGIIQSLTGGFTFPDGTTQTTAATGGPAGMVLLATVDASNVSSVTFGSTYITSAYSKYQLEFDGAYSPASAAAGAILGLQFSTNNGSTWATSGYTAHYGLGTGTTSTSIRVAGDSALSTGPSTPSPVAIGAIQGTVKFSVAANGTLNVSFQSDGSMNGDSTANSTLVSYLGTATYYGTSGNPVPLAINALRFIDDSGNGVNFSGRFHLYGLSGT